MRTFSAALLAATLVMTNAFAAPLSAGKPAGVKEAQSQAPSALMIITGIGLAGVGFGLAASNSGGGPKSTTNSVTGSVP